MANISYCCVSWTYVMLQSAQPRFRSRLKAQDQQIKGNKEKGCRQKEAYGCGFFELTSYLCRENIFSRNCCQ